MRLARSQNVSKPYQYRGCTFYVSTGRGKKVFAIDTKLRVRLRLGLVLGGLALSLDGKLLFAADGPSGLLLVVDWESMAVVKRIKAGDGPWGVAIVKK